MIENSYKKPSSAIPRQNKKVVIKNECCQKRNISTSKMGLYFNTSVGQNVKHPSLTMI